VRLVRVNRTDWHCAVLTDFVFLIHLEYRSHITAVITFIISVIPNMHSSLKQMKHVFSFLWQFATFGSKEVKIFYDHEALRVLMRFYTKHYKVSERKVIFQCSISLAVVLLVSFVVICCSQHVEWFDVFLRRDVWGLSVSVLFVSWSPLCRRWIFGPRGWFVDEIEKNGRKLDHEDAIQRWFVAWKRKEKGVNRRILI
jgi:hypothetical protein